MDNCIILKKPQIEYTDWGAVRLTVEITEPNRPVFHGFVEVEKEYEQYLSPERADWLLYLAFPVAIREGYDIVCEAPVTEMFLHNINEILIPHYLIADSNAKKFKIHADTTSEIIGGNAIGTAISCGVDSTYTTMEYTSNKYPSMQLTHLFIASVNAEIWDFDEQNDNLYTWEEKHKEAFQRYSIVSESTGLPLVKMFTNIIWYVCKRDWKDYHHAFVHHYITMAAVLSLRKLWKIYYFSSAENFVTAFAKSDWLHKDTAYMELLSMHMLALHDFHCYSGGASVDRIEKTRQLTDYEPAKKVLHPCHKRGKKNCSDPWCGKCLRALITFDYYDKLDEMQEVFDIERYKDKRMEYLWWLAHWRNDGMFSALYNMMSEKYPEDMKTATERYEQWAKPVPRPEFDGLVHVYNISLSLLTLESPHDIILGFFKEKGITKLYCSGYSSIGNTVISIIANDIELITYQTGKVSDCDAAYILATKQSDIENIKRNLKTDKPIYTIFDIEKYIKSK